MSGSYFKELRKMTRERGWAMEAAKSGHWRLTKPGCPAVTCSASPRGREATIGAVRRDLDRAEGRRPGWATSGT